MMSAHCSGVAGSFFKNPTVTPEQCADIIAREPKIVHYPMDDGSIKLAAGWLIDACGWKGKSMGRAGVYDKQALVLVNRGDRHSRSEEHTSELQSQSNLVCRLLLEKKKKKNKENSA